MLEGLFGRGFSAKCKPLIKTTRARILVIRRRVVAKQRFLKGDLAKLLSDGLDMNAYGRIEEFAAGMNLLFCYDYVDQACESILKQLSKMQKLDDCPEECKEAISLLMFAAARFSDLPELRELRDIFQQRYGSLEALVNQKFVERLFPRPPTSENKIQVLQNIASEFSIKWDAKGFEQRIEIPTVVQVQSQKANLVQQKSGGPDNYRDNNNMKRRDEPEPHFAAVKCRENSMLKNDATILQVGSSFPERRILSKKKHEDHVRKDYYGKQLVVEKSDASSPLEKMVDNGNGNVEPVKEESRQTIFSGKANSGSIRGERLDREESAISSSHRDKAQNTTSGGKAFSSHGAQLPYIKVQDTVARPSPYTNGNGKIEPVKEESTQTTFSGKADFASIHGERLVREETAVLSSHRDKAQNTTSEGKAFSSYGVPPPYIKVQDTVARPPPYTKPKEGPSTKTAAVSDQEDLFVNRVAVSSSHKENGLVKEAEGQNQVENRNIPCPKPESVRRRLHKSSSSSSNRVMDSVNENEEVTRSSTSRRRHHSGKGLHGYFDEEHRRKDEEERMIDKLLIHYSKRPSHMTEAGQSSHDKSIHGEIRPPPSRSASLPREQTNTLPGTKRVLNRASSFQPDNQARHVHPKLPDYDDIAAKFAALKGR